MPISLFRCLKLIVLLFHVSESFNVIAPVKWGSINRATLHAENSDSDSDVSSFIRRRSPSSPDTDSFPVAKKLPDDEPKPFGERVFDKLVSYPCTFSIKVIGLKQGNFAIEIVDIVARVCKVSAVREYISMRVKLYFVIFMGAC